MAQNNKTKTDQYNDRLKATKEAIVSLVGLDRWIELRFEYAMQYLEHMYALPDVEWDFVSIFVSNPKFWTFWNWAWSHQDIVILQNFTEKEISTRYKELKITMIDNPNLARDFSNYLNGKKENDNITKQISA